MTEKRDFFWDNLKAVLIFLVVFGHCLELCSRETSLAIYTDKLIYCFHMPAFIFVSGFWSKRYCIEGKVKAEKAVTLIAYYLVFQVLFSVITVIMQPGTAVSIFNPNRGLWYLLAMIAYYLLVPVAEKLPPWLVLGLSVVFSLLIGADKKEIGNYLGMQRIITFAPFFFAGYYLSAERVNKLRLLNICIRLIISSLLTGAVIAALIIKREALSMNLFYAKISYSQMHHSFFQGVALRGIALVLAAMLTLALLLIVPSKKMFFSQVGKNSLHIFVLHMTAICIILRIPSIHFVIDSYLDFGVAVVTALAVTALLSLNVFGYPFKWIRAGANKLIKK